MDDCDALFRLNQDLFMAEEQQPIGGQSWREWLEHVLADDFTIRRANPAVPRQDRTGMIDWIEAHPIVHRDQLPVESLWCSRSLGVIAGPVLVRDGQGKARRYQNIKVFRRDPERGWQCVYWQVSEEVG